MRNFQFWPFLGIRAGLDGAGDGEVQSPRQDDEDRRGEDGKQGSDGALNSDDDDHENDITPEVRDENMELDDVDEGRDKDKA